MEHLIFIEQTRRNPPMDKLWLIKPDCTWKDLDETEKKLAYESLNTMYEDARHQLSALLKEWFTLTNERYGEQKTKMQLIIDTPTDCFACPCCSDYRCNVLKKHLLDLDFEYDENHHVISRPRNCPLKSVWER